MAIPPDWGIRDCLEVSVGGCTNHRTELGCAGHAFAHQEAVKPRIQMILSAGLSDPVGPFQ